MTRNHLRAILALVLVFYAGAFGLGMYLRIPFATEPSGYYTTYKDLIPLIIAVPAAYLVYAFQRRASYLQALRGLWTHLVSAISSVLVYMDTPSPTQEKQLEVLEKLSVAVEEVRGVFKNVPARGTRDGWYPFEPVKQIYEEILAVGFGSDATLEKRADAKKRIYEMWKSSRARLLAEFDRDKPTHHHAEYAAR